MYWGSFPPYVSVAQRKEKSRRKIEQLKKKNKNINPVIINGSTIARTWWGKSWNANLERYADFSNRIGRGKSYVRHGAVLDLQIEKGCITSLVQGSRSTPYKITITIDPIHKKKWEQIHAACKGVFDSLLDLLTGTIPKNLVDIFMHKDKGLFPSPKEIHFACSCPDGAWMCKHIAATLYGVGARLDDDARLFFSLRTVDVQNLVSKVVEHEKKSLLKKAQKKSDRIIDNAALDKLFGIDIDEKKVRNDEKKSSKKETKKAQKKIQKYVKQEHSKKSKRVRTGSTT